MRFSLSRSLKLTALAGASLLLLGGCSLSDSLQPPETAPPPGMVTIPGGSFLTGSEEFPGDPDVGQLRTAEVRAFYIDVTEVSNAEVLAVWPEHTYPEGEDHKPATGLAFEQVVEVLSRMDKRLPSKLEWEKAARGEDGRIFPWGNEPVYENRAHVGVPNSKDWGEDACPWGQMVEVTANAAGASPYGLLNTVGNAWEFVGDPPTKTRPYHMIKGGAYGYRPQYNRLDTVSYEQPGVT